MIVGTPSLERSEIIREIDNLTLPHAGADLPAAVAAVRQIVENARTENPRLARHEVCFLTDLQRVTWAPKLSEAASADFLSQTGELAEAASLLVIDLGLPAEENMAIPALRTADSLIAVGQASPLEVTLRDFNGQGAASLHGGTADRRAADRAEAGRDSPGRNGLGPVLGPVRCAWAIMRSRPA